MGPGIGRRAAPLSAGPESATERKAGLSLTHCAGPGAEARHDRGQAGCLAALTRETSPFPLYLQAERLDQIQPLHFRVPPQRFRTAGAEDPPVINDVSPVGHHQRLANVMV